MHERIEINDRCHFTLSQYEEDDLSLETRDADGDLTVVDLNPEVAAKLIEHLSVFVEKTRKVSVEVPARYEDKVKNFIESLKSGSQEW